MSFLNQPASPPKDSLRSQALRCLRAGQRDQAISLLTQALKETPNDGLVHNDLAFSLTQAGQMHKAEKHYKKALHLLPDHPRVHAGYGGFLVQKGSLQKAEEHLKKALAAAPKDPEALNNLGMCYHNQGRLDEAESLYISAIQALPPWPDPHYNIGRLYHRKHFIARAQAAFEKTVALQPTHAQAWCALGVLFDEQKKPDQAVACLEKSIQLNPLLEAGWVNLVRVHRTNNQTEKRRQALNAALNHIKDSPGLLFEQISLLQHDGQDDEALKIFNALTDVSNIPLSLFYEMGSLYDKKGDVRRAFSYFEKANTLCKKETDALDYPRDNFPDMIKALRKEVAENGKNWAPSPPLPTGMPSPVFLVGFPRSGTTLLEQIFASHPDIDTAEEVGAAGIATGTIVMEKKKDIEHCLGDITDEDIQKAREAYFATLKQSGFSPKADRVFIDKMPLNLVYAPVIHRIFPDARFILALRHPCDCVLSCYMQYFAFNQAMLHMTDLKSAAKIYDLSFDAWDVFVKTLVLNVCTVKYENIVGDLKSEATKALEFMGLDWRDELARFDKTAQKRSIMTPSARQVREKIYTRALARWKKYEDQMQKAGALDILLPWADKHGYPLDQESS